MEQQHPPFWNIPHQRNPFFTGREETLSYLYKSLAADNVVMLTQAQSITGLVGIGKTQPAVAFAYRFHSDDRPISCITADTNSIITSDFVHVATVLHLPEKDNQDQNTIIEAVKKWLKTHAHWLLIFDNVEDILALNNYLPTAYRGHVLLTTRAHTIG